MALDTDVDTVKRLYAASIEKVPASDPVMVKMLRWKQSEIEEMIRELLAPSAGGADRLLHLPSIAHHLWLEDAIGISSDDIARTIYAIFYVIGIHPMVRLSDPAWHEAICLGRALAARLSHTKEWWLTAIQDAAIRLRNQGYVLTVLDGAYQFAPGHAERATAEVQSIINSVGLKSMLTEIFLELSRAYVHRFGVVLFGRRSTLDVRAPAIPFGFLINLALRGPEKNVPRAIARDEYRKAAALAKDIVAVLGVETFYQPAGPITPPSRLEASLRRTAQFDHLIGFRQWPPSGVEPILKSFFSGAKVNFAERKLGWTIGDAVALWALVERGSQEFGPKLFSLQDLSLSGVPTIRLTAMLRSLSIERSTVNAGYDSPFSAGSCRRQMAYLKPFIILDDQSYLILSRGSAGYGFYEAIMTALRAHVSESEMKDLVGDGTERVVKALLEGKGIAVRPLNKKYRLKSPKEDGEFDVVAESDKHIVIFECKAKPLSSDAMGGASAAGLLDFAGGVFNAHIQAVRHERILRQRGSIDLVGGGRIELRGREIVRICTTLIDLGALQDSLMLYCVTPPLGSVKFIPDPAFPKAASVEEFNEKILRLNSEMKALETLGKKSNEVMIKSLSLNVGQFAVLIGDSIDLDDFVRRAGSHVTHGTLNALLEYHHCIELGLYL